MAETWTYDRRNLDDGLNMMDAFKRFIASMLSALMSSSRGLKASDLNENQKYAVAVMAGCPMELACDGEMAGRMTLTTVPCEITDDDDGGWVVLWHDGDGRLVRGVCWLIDDVVHVNLEPKIKA